MRTSTKRAMLIFALCALCGVALAGGVVSAFFGLPYFASFECAFIGLSLILSASFFGIIKQVQRAKEEALLAELNAQKQESAQDSNKSKNAECEREAEFTSAETIQSKEIDSHQPNSVAESTNLISQKTPSVSAQAKCKQAFAEPSGIHSREGDTIDRIKAEAKCDSLATDDTINGIAGMDCFARLALARNDENPTRGDENPARHCEDSQNPKQSTKDFHQSKETIPFTSRFLVGVKLSFSFLRLLCYMGFIFALIGLLESKLFEPVSFLVGGIASIVVVIAIALQSLYKN
ncbi:hypothetical protein CQA49_03350 [Helicobacter sp. MIT 00-7814]|uniref:hypothetical protein n=1 Tax=unclassified Helicobacter TaxID=2593540 RepID=UPI000E1F42AF|nr:MULTISPECIES: hypothetical protein [unclassified Helicobacter]RDU55511.1 hypothetical protein CQA37_03770 [Helicobacter sp. MIT 99-10781]RDU55601.1 hypothetical protein CQA49_03350 [Helicobacter sp. MIT 00-7814]